MRLPETNEAPGVCEFGGCAVLIATDTRIEKSFEDLSIRERECVPALRIEAVPRPEVHMKGASENLGTFEMQISNDLVAYERTEFTSGHEFELNRTLRRASRCLKKNQDPAEPVPAVVPTLR
jgi:hypothetical protein